MAYMEPHPTPPPRWPSWPEVRGKKNGQLVSWSATQFSSHDGKHNYHLGTKLIPKHAKYASKTYGNNLIFYSMSYMEYSIIKGSSVRKFPNYERLSWLAASFLTMMVNHHGNHIFMKVSVKDRECLNSGLKTLSRPKLCILLGKVAAVVA